MPRKSYGLLTLALALVAFAAFSSPALAAPPANDNFANADPLNAGVPSRAYAGLTDATREPGEPVVPGSDTDRTVWLSWTATANGLVRVSTCDTGNVAFTGGSLGIYTGASVTNLTPLAQATDNCGNGFSNAITSPISVTAGQTYFIQVGEDTASTSADASVSVDFASSVPANDDLANASVITGSLPQTIDANNHLATNQAGEPDINVGSQPENTNSIWYSWVAPSDETIALDTCSSLPASGEDDSMDSEIWVYSAAGTTSNFGDLTSEESDDDGCDSYNLSYVTQDVTAGTTYYIRVSNYGDGVGEDYKLRMRVLGAPFAFEPPTTYSPLVIAGDEIDTDSGNWDSGNGPLAFTYAWKRCDAQGANCTTLPGETGISYETVPGDEGHTFVLSVTGDDGVDTPVTVDSNETYVVAEAPNDSIVDAINLGSALPATIDGHNVDTGEAPDQNAPYTAMNHTVWYKWTAPTTERVNIGTCDTPDWPYNNPAIDLQIGVYVGNGASEGPDDSHLVAGGPDGCSAGSSSGQTAVNVDVTAGTTYWVQIGSAIWFLPGNDNGTMGLFRLTIKPAPLPAPPAPAVPLQNPLAKLHLANSLGTVKLSSTGKMKLGRLHLNCPASASGPCTGTIRITTKTKRLRHGKKIKPVTQTFKISIKPGQSLNQVLKANSKLKRVIKRARRLNATVRVELRAPGFKARIDHTKVTFTR